MGRTTIERRAAGEIRRTFDAKGRLVAAAYFHEGKRRGFYLQLDPRKNTGELRSPDGMAADMWAGGVASFYTAWHDGPASSSEVSLDEWIEGCLDDMRRTSWSYLAVEAADALRSGDARSARAKYRLFLSQSEALFGGADLAHIRFYAAVAEAACVKGASERDRAAGAALAAALAGKWASRDEKKTRKEAGRWLAKHLPRERVHTVLDAAARTGIERAVADAKSSADVWTRLDTLSARLEDVMAKCGAAIFGEAALALEELHVEVKRFAAGATTSGDTDAAVRVGRELASAKGAPIRDLNNLANALVVKRDFDGAEKVLAEVGDRIAKRRPARGRRAKLQHLADEYFYRTHLADLRWQQQRYEEALPHAERAHAAEEALLDAGSFDDPFAGEKRYAVELAFSTGTWALVSTLTRLRRLDEAEVVFEWFLEPARFRARHRRNARLAEHALLGCTCVYTENKTKQMIERSRRLCDRMFALLPEPEGGLLSSQYACLLALYGEKERALEMVRRAVQLGWDRKALRDDPDLESLRSDPRFTQLVG